VRLKPDINNGALHEDRCTLVIIPRWILLVTRNVSDKVVEKIKTHFVFNNFFLLSFSFKNRALYEIMWKIWPGQTDRHS